MMKSSAKDIEVAAGLPAQVERFSWGDVDLEYLRAARLEQFVDEALLAESGQHIEPPYWMHLWPSSLVLARRIAEIPKQSGQTACELGCGLGLPSLVAAARGLKILATDWKREPLQFLAASAKRNDLEIQTAQMDWSTLAVAGKFDWCFGADVAYDFHGADVLAAAVCGCLEAGGRFWLVDSVNTHRADIVDALHAVAVDVVESVLPAEEDGRRVWVRMIEGRRSE